MRRRKRIDISQIVLNIILFFFSLAFLIPFLQVITSSFTSQEDIMKFGAFSIIPRSFDTSAYSALLSSATISRSAFVSLMRTIVGTGLSLIVTAMMAFGLSRRNLVGKNIFITIIFITLIFSGGLIPTYMVVNTLRLTNTFWAMIIPSLVSTYNFILMKTFFMDIPQSLEEAATIDGSTPFKYFVKIVIPVSKPMLATIALFYAVGHWNAWFDASIYLSDYKKMPLQIILRDIIIKFTDTNLNLGLSLAAANKRPPGIAMRSALMVITTVPIVCVYPFLQRYFVKGVMVGSIKG